MSAARPAGPLYHATATELARRVAAPEVAPEEVLRQHLDRIAVV